jgi:hypothetical protein
MANEKMAKIHTWLSSSLMQDLFDEMQVSY